MDKNLAGVLTYDPTQIDVRLKCIDGSVLKPYGFSSGENLWYENGSIFLSFQTISPFVSELIEKLYELENDLVEVQLKSSNRDLSTVLSKFNGNKGRLTIIKSGFCNSKEIPNTLIQITL